MNMKEIDQEGSANPSAPLDLPIPLHYELSLIDRNSLHLSMTVMVLNPNHMQIW